MKIGIDASRANVKQKTGTEWYSYRLIQGFKKIAEVNDQYFLYSKESLNYGLEDLPPNFTSEVLKWPPKFLWTQIRLSLHFYSKKPDVLFIPAHTIPLIHPKKTVLTVHDVGFERYTQLYSKDVIGQKGIRKRVMSAGVRAFTLGKYGSNELDYHRWAMNYAIKHATKIIVPSEFTKKEIIDIYNIPESKITVIYHGIDHERYFVVPDQDKVVNIQKKYKINPPYLFFVGRLEEKKNTAGLVKAFAIAKKKYQIPHTLVLTGNPGYNFEAVRDEILKNNITRRVDMPGYINSEDLVYLLNGADIFMFTTFYEGFGLPVIEAMACGTPVIASNRTSIPEVAGDAALLVDPNNHEQIANAIYKVVSQPEVREKMVDEGFKQIKKFDWEKCAQETLNVITNI